MGLLAWRGFLTNESVFRGQRKSLVAFEFMSARCGATEGNPAKRSSPGALARLEIGLTRQSAADFFGRLA